MIRRAGLMAGARPETVADVMLLHEQERRTPKDEKAMAELLVMRGLLHGEKIKT